MSQVGAVIYCADTSAVIDMKSTYPFQRFPSLWSNLDQLVADGRLIAPTQVLEELERGDDELTKWARSNQKIFVGASEELLQMAREVIGRHPDLVDPNKEHEDADPYVIALATLRNQGQLDLLSGSICVVLTQEHRRIGKSRIPHACATFGLECFGPIQLIEKEGWAF